MREINVNTLKNYVQFLAAKDVAGGYIPPDRFNEMLPIVVHKMIRKYYGVPEEYQPGMPMPRISYEITQLVTDYVSQLIETVLLNVDTFGKAIKPEDYLHLSSLSVNSNIVLTDEEIDDIESNKVVSKCCETVQSKYKSSVSKVKNQWRVVTPVAEKERWAILDSVLRQPTSQYPICVFLADDTIQFYPEYIKLAYMSYIRYPKKPIWGYTIVGGIPVYDPNTSVDIELPEICADELAVTILDRLGITIREPGLVEWSRYIKEKGI